MFGIKKGLAILSLCVVTFSITACGTQEATTEKPAKAQSVAAQDAQSNDPVQGNFKSYKYSANSRFKIISVQAIDDGTMNGMVISTLVDKETKVMYMQTEKFQMGYGLSTVVLIDKDGKPLLYNGNLN